MIIAVDFDGTIVEHKYPEMGDPVPGAIETLKDLSKHGVQLILWTIRSGEKLDEAVHYLTENGIKLKGVNQNPDQAIWSPSPKAYANFYIDDAAIGCPLIFPDNEERPYVNWIEIRNLLGLF